MTYTPMMMQYLSIKEHYQDTILFYRLGDFYEMFFDDAKIASKELDLVLTGRNAGQTEKVPMCGVPYHAKNPYINKLVEKGYKVGIVEQLEEAQAGKMVNRGVVEIITPGTLLNDEQEKNIINICGLYDYQYGYSLVFIDISTGKTKAINIDYNLGNLKSLLLKYNVKEIVFNLNYNYDKLLFIKDMGIAISFSNDEVLDDMYKHLYQHIQNDIRIINAYTIVVNYLKSTKFNILEHLQVIEIDDLNKYLKLDYNTILNLELIKPLQNQTNNITLYTFLDKCKSSMGSRLMKDLIQKPLMNINDINDRLDIVTILKNNIILQNELKDSLDKLYDIERIVGKLSLNSFTPTDAIRLKKTLEVIPSIKEMLRNYIEFESLIEFSDCQHLYNLLNDSIREDASININEGHVIKYGYDKELDELLDVKTNSKQWLIKQEQIEREKTGINNLKIGYNKVFGYYIEVSKSNISKIKDEYGYIRKQTLTNQERYITSELKEKEDMILNSFDKAIRREIIIFNNIKDIIKKDIEQLQILSYKLSYIDCLYAFSIISSMSGYTRPEFNDKELKIIKGKHPILESIMKKDYVSNDCILNEDEDILLLTGPNMGGKSTYKRQVALLVIMAQMGIYVPCKSATLPIFDAIFTRIGASDDILSGQSTFMVEMSEANYALTNATCNSLIIFDEIGRGTSTYDGLSIAKAMIEYISNNIKCKTLFSTHYHELTTLEKEFNNIVNYQVVVHEENDHITFMYQVKKGKANKSYGINVAKLAGINQEIILRAKYILEHLETNTVSYMEPLFKEEVTLVKEDNKVINKLKLVNTDNLSPLEALILLNELKKDID